MTGIICAMPKESADIIAKMSEISEQTIGSVCYRSGKLYGREVVLAVCGMGKVSAAICTQLMITVFKVDEIINVGVAGALSADLKIFDIVVADKLCQHDFDTTAIGDPLGFISGINQTFFQTCERMNNKLIECIKDNGGSYHHGNIASGDQFIVKPEHKKQINEAFDAVACEMEGAAVAQVCYMNGVDFAVLRAISDGEGADMDYMQFAEIAAKSSAAVLIEYIKRV